MRIAVNPIECTAHGICAELLPEWIQLDEWGYAAVDAQDLPLVLLKQARAAAAACPALALRLSSG